MPLKFLCMLLSLTSLAPTAHAAFEFDRIDGDALIFKPETQAPLRTGLQEIRYWGQLRPEGNSAPDKGGEPYFLFSGRDCTGFAKGSGCTNDTQLFAYRPTRGRVATFTYPGKLLDPKTREVLYESRAFFGKCLLDRGDVLVVYQREKVGKKRPHMGNSVYVAEAEPEYFREKLQEKRKPTLNATLNLVKKKLCAEVEPKNRINPVRPLFDTPHSPSPEDKDEDEIEENESAPAASPSPR